MYASGAKLTATGNEIDSLNGPVPNLVPIMLVEESVVRQKLRR